MHVSMLERKSAINPMKVSPQKRVGLWILTLASITWMLIVLAPTITPTPAVASVGSLNLHRYVSYSPPVTIAGVYNNASGLTYNPQTNTLFAVINNPEKIVEIDAQGNTLRQVLLEGFEDTEAITYLGNGDYAVVEERRRSIVIAHISFDTRVLKRSEQRSLSLPRTAANNNGFEGIAVDSNTGRLYISNEKAPRELFQLDGFVESSPHMSVSYPWDIEEAPLGNDDISGLYFDHHRNHLLLLSDESKQLVEANLRGDKVSELDLSSRNPSLAQDIPQAEGITLGENNTLFILSEPNLLYKFERME